MRKKKSKIDKLIEWISIGVYGLIIFISASVVVMFFIRILGGLFKGLYYNIFG